MYIGKSSAEKEVQCFPNLLQSWADLVFLSLTAVSMQLACFNYRNLPNFQRSAQQRYQDNSAKGCANSSAGSEEKKEHWCNA